ncbi:MAG: LysM peptidoglycan-binding domain-containing protein [Duncaniella sp.]|nr:LysM peptidoglycan-binding domain-containing protein [Muribaculum sp.]MCM1255829.1 LysM peptidoglycan-binding domain-containing protein [Duncaniella sp.]
MNLSRRFAATVSILTAAAICLSASVKDLPVRTVNGKSYYCYDIISKETVYSLCHKLSVSKEEIIKYNPSVADGLKAGVTLYFPVQDDINTNTADASTSTSERIITHTVKKGETIYGISSKYGISSELLISQNPIVTEGLKIGQELHLTIPSSNLPKAEVPETTVVTEPVTAKAQKPDMKGYIVKKKETFYSIAQANGLTVAQLESANPNVTILKEGQVLNIPSPQSFIVQTVTTDTIPTDTIATPNVHTLSIAVILPFMLKEETPSKNAIRYTEFYKGMLLAMDSLRNNGTPIHISAYDSEGSLDKVKELLEMPELKQKRIIIAPDNAAQLTAIGEFGRNNGIKVFNPFIVKDESFMTNPEMMQANMPSAQMYEKAIDAYTERLLYSYPVFVSFNEAQGDKIDFVNDLKKKLNDRGIEFGTLAIDTHLSSAELKQLPAKESYTFIPTTSKQSDLNRIMPGLIEWRDNDITGTVRLFGYPEWTTFRGETLENMNNLNTIVYSRFYTDDDNYRAKALENKFKQWYGNSMENAVPRQGLLGFDTGMFIIKYLKYPSARYDGIQNGFTFISPDDAEGWYNNVLYLVNFRPGGIIEKINL